MRMDMSQEAFCAEIYRENDGRFRYHLDWTVGLNTYCKNPQCGRAVWGIIGKDGKALGVVSRGTISFGSLVLVGFLPDSQWVDPANICQQPTTSTWMSDAGGQYYKYTVIIKFFLFSPSQQV